MIAERNEAILNQFGQYLTHIALSPKTVTNYLADLRAFVRWVEHRQPQGFLLPAVTPDQIRAYRSHLLDEHRAPSTINRHLQAIRKCCAYISQANLASRNAAEEISLVKTPRRMDTSHLTRIDLAALLAAANNGRVSITARDRAILHLLMHAGLRVTEVLELRTDDIVFDYPGIHLTIQDSRGGAPRNIPLPDAVCTALNGWMVIRPSQGKYQQVFLSQEGKPISARTVQRIVSRCAKSSGQSGVTAQVLRRVYALRLLNESSDLALVSRRLGHKSQKITSTYLGLGNNSSQIHLS